MGDFAVEGAELKRMIKVARQQPVPFAFNPGKNDSEHYLAMHRKRSAAQLGKVAKQDGVGKKVAFGTAEIDGKCLNLTCERNLPTLAKRIKKYLKSQKIMLNVRVLDPEGNLLESDEDDAIPDDPSLDDAAPKDAAPEPEATPAETPDADGPDAEPETEPDTGPDAGAIAAQLAADRDRMSALPEDQRQKLVAPLQAVVALLKSGELAQAAAGADKITAALDKLLAAQGADQAAAVDTAALAQRLKAAHVGLAEIANADAVAKLTQAIKVAAETLRGQDAETAAGQIERIEAAMARLTGAGAAPPETGASAAPPQPDAAAQARAKTGIAEGTVKKRAFLATRWQKIPAEIKAEIGKLRSAMRADVPEEEPDALAAAMEKTLDTFCADMQEALDDAINAGDPGYTKSVGLIGDFRTRVQSDKLIQHIKDNPFDGGADVEPVLLAALDEMQDVLSA
ncbi:hypothetical protein ACFMPD_16455 [Sedimentitalea sp. HM32M-2]|uniref:hypothetical protein n=1 Tax=Sedimentitalea sp. HM32M-2 TaxID=3351566 RepID=UPI00363FEA31